MRNTCIVTLVCLMLVPGIAIGAGTGQQGLPMPMLANPAAMPASPVVPNPAQGDTKITGKVAEMLNAGRYVYIRVESADGTAWAAAPGLEVAVGDTVAFRRGLEMVDYHSKTLDRNFDLVYFVERVDVVDGTPTEAAEPIIPQGHGADPAAKKPEVDLSGIAKAEGGKTVGEVFTEKAALAGKEVAIRGKVVKFMSGVMGKNWIHLQDGTAGPAGEDDLTVTTSGKATVGSVALVRGTLTTDKDFGFGYHYDVILEDATITVE